MTESTDEFWQVVYNRNIRKLIGVCYRYTRDRQLSEDLAHDAFLKAIERSGSFEGKGNFDAWLRKIVVNHVLQYIREQNRKKNIKWSMVDGADVHAEVNDVHQTSPPANEFSETELLNAINNLPEHHRLVFNLYVIDNFTHAHIGELLGISAGTSKSHLARARKKLKKILVQKVDKESGRRKSLLLLFLFPNKYGDTLLKEQIGNFDIPPANVRALNIAGMHVAPHIKLHPVATAWNMAITAVTVGIMVSVVVLVNQKQRNTGTFETSLNLALAPDNQKADDPDTTAHHKNTSHISGPNAATLSPNGVMINKNNKRMKKIDSLGIMLLVSSSMVLDSTAQAFAKKDTLTRIETMTADAGVPIKPVDINDHSSPSSGPGKSKLQQGTFSASSLLWSGKNNELYINGVVRVETNEQNFSGDGTFSFLGPVYLVILNGTPVTLDSTVKLPRQKHQLVMLNEKTAIEKYGEKGRQGAVEITVTEQ